MSDREEILRKLAIASTCPEMTSERWEYLFYGDILESCPDAEAMWNRVDRLDFDETMRLLELQSRMAERWSYIQEVVQTDDEVHQVLTLLVDGPNNTALGRLATTLRRGDVPQDILDVLAGLLDPDGGGIANKRLALGRVGPGRPEKMQSPEFEHFVHLNCILFPPSSDSKMEVVAATAMERFGCARSTFFEVYRKHAECWTQDELEHRRAVAENLRRAGNPDFQPLR